MTVIPPIPDTTATVTITDVLDKDNKPVEKNTKTESLIITAKGTAAANTELWLRDRLSRISDVKSGPGGFWSKTFTLSQYKCVALSAIEKVDGGYSEAWNFTTVTATPLINTVTGNGKPIENGGSYDGESAEFIGNAPPDTTLKVFDGSTELSETATVNSCGLFKFDLKELGGKEYNIKFQEPGGKESEVFTFTVAVESPTSIDDVLDDNENSVGEGKSTIEKNLTIIGMSKPLSTVKLVGGVPTTVDVPVDAEGEWRHRFENLPNADYSITAESSGTPLAPTDPRTFTVRAAEEVKLLNITDREGNVIDEGSITPHQSLYVNCTGEKGKKIQAVDVDADGETSLGEEIVKDDGECQIAIGPLSDKSYKVKVVGLYPEGGESGTYSFTVETAEQSEITHIFGANYEVIENGGETTSRWFTIRGKAGANEHMKLNGSHETPEPTDTANDKGVCIFFISKIPLRTHTYTIQKSDGSTPASEPWEVTVSAP